MRSFGDPVLDKFVDALKRRMTQKLADVRMVAVFGSRLRRDFSYRSDLDLLVILCRDSESPFECVRKYFLFINVLKDSISEAGDGVVVVPVNLLKEFLRYVAKIANDKKEVKIVHLLLYFTDRQFI